MVRESVPESSMLLLLLLPHPEAIGDALQPPLDVSALCSWGHWPDVSVQGDPTPSKGMHHPPHASQAVIASSQPS